MAKQSRSPGKHNFLSIFVCLVGINISNELERICKWESWSTHKYLSYGWNTTLEYLSFASTFAVASSLEELSVDGCVQLKSIQGLEHLTKLWWLIVRKCAELEELPSMETLTSLEKLWVDKYVNLVSIETLVSFTHERTVNRVLISKKEMQTLHLD